MVNYPSVERTIIVILSFFLITFAMAVPGYQDAVMLFGDSLTQAFSAGSLAQRMAEHFSRRLDVINRGFGGYNTDWAIPALEQVFPTREQRENGCAQKVQLLTIWFGANDAVLPGCRQHVPLERFKDNIHKLVAMVNTPDSLWYSPEARIVLISNPPVVPDDRASAMIARWKEFGSVGGPPKLDRDPVITKQYSEAMVQVAKQEGLEVVDAWHAIVAAACGDDPTRLAPFFYDGLHLTTKGYAVIFDRLVAVVSQKWPELEPEQMTMPMPHHAQVDIARPRRQLGRVKDEL